MTEPAAMPTITPLPAFRDNYIWALHDGRQAVVVDPGAAAPVLDFLRQHRLELAAILVTHHHADHCGGLAELAVAHACPVYGPQRESISGVTHPVGEGERLAVAGERLTVWEIPGHTRGHLAFVAAGGVFCGDTLFGAGCGRVFDGSLPQLYQSLQRLAALPDDTRIYCAHEYTLANLRFALACEPDHLPIRQRQRDTEALRAAGLPSLPSNIGLERATNPFLRCAEPAVRQAAERYAGQPLSDELAVFSVLRGWRSAFTV